jgi:hypothetical protein
VLHQQEVSSGGYRQEFGEALDNAEDECLEEVEGHEGSADREKGAGLMGTWDGNKKAGN